MISWVLLELSISSSLILSEILIPSTFINHQKVTFEKETLDNSNISEN